MREVFISYKSRETAPDSIDETVASELCQQLEAAGITCWMAPRDIEPGNRFAPAIMEALENCNAMVVVFSRFANESEHIANEVNTAFARKIDIIPFKIDRSQPKSELKYYLCRMQWINASDNFRSKIPELIDALRHKLGRNAEQPDQGYVIDAPRTPKKVSVSSKTLEFTAYGVSFKMIQVEGGTFMMGGTPEQGIDALSDEMPTHQVTLSTYHIGQTQVTQELWRAVMGDNPSMFRGDLQRPVDSVSWLDCQKFLKRLTKLTGQEFRLPTEAEWEYAARGGSNSKGYKYPGSNDFVKVAWYIDNSNSITHPVGKKEANELGIYDMCGNVWEWCYDWYGPYGRNSQINPTGPKTGFCHVIRGGSWLDDAGYFRVSRRSYLGPMIIGRDLGFRLVF